MEQCNPNITRASFLKTAGIAGAAAAAASLTASAAHADEAAEAAVSEYPEAEPIAPLAAPDQWTEEYDIVIVGAGGGGLAAALLSAQNGAKALVIEKDPDFGGATQHAQGWLNVYGGSRQQDEAKYGYPEYPTDPKAFQKKMLEEYGRTVNLKLLMSLATKGGEVADFMEDNGVEWFCAGSFVVPLCGMDGTQNSVLGMRTSCEVIYNAAVDAGTVFKFSSPCSGLVLEDGCVTGVRADTPDGEAYFKANKGVILCSGGFGMNNDMLAKYIPTGYAGMVCGGPIPSHTGECTRMALGCGADMAGYDSWSMWESMPDNDTGDYNYFWGGEVQLCRNPWLNIDRDGNRYQFYHNRTWPVEEGGPTLIGGAGDWAVAETMNALPGHRGYTIFDSGYADNIATLSQTALRQPIRPEDPMIPEAEMYVSHNWLDDIEPAIKAGMIKRADTIEELADMLGLDRDVLVGAVERWNDMCDRGEDDELLFPYPPAWLIKVANPPFYGAKIGGHIGKTMCGLRVNEDLQVIDTNGKTIPGLYANFTTAGGMAGEGTWGGKDINCSIFGGNALSWVSGYVACQSVLAL